jgi:hypothetical protein
MPFINMDGPIRIASHPSICPHLKLDICLPVPSKMKCNETRKERSTLLSRPQTSPGGFVRDIDGYGPFEGAEVCLARKCLLPPQLLV